MGRKQPLLPHNLAKLFVHKGDEVMVLTGKDKGKHGRVERTYPRSSRVIVEGLNIAKRHMKAAPSQPAGIIEKAMPLHASNVMVVHTPGCGNPTRIAHERVAQGADQKIRVRRVCKKCGQPILEQSRTIGE